MTKQRQRERKKRRQEAIKRGEYQERRPYLSEPRFTDPTGRRWIDEGEYLKFLEEGKWLAAKFGPKDEYSDEEIEVMSGDPQLEAAFARIDLGARE